MVQKKHSQCRATQNSSQIFDGEPKKALDAVKRDIMDGIAKYGADVTAEHLSNELNIHGGQSSASFVTLEDVIS